MIKKTIAHFVSTTTKKKNDNKKLGTMLVYAVIHNDNLKIELFLLFLLIVSMDDACMLRCEHNYKTVCDIAECCKNIKRRKKVNFVCFE